MNRDRKGQVFQTAIPKGSLTRYRFVWTSNAAGDAVFKCLPMPGVAVEVAWSNSDAGGETYSATLIDDLAADWLLGLVSGKSTGASSRAALVDVTVTSSESRPAPLPDGLWFVVDCSASAQRSGVIDIWVKP